MVTTNILEHHSPNIDGPNRLTTTFKIILLLKRLEINIIANSNITWPKVINSGNLPLEQILQYHPKYKTLKQQLHHKQILYLEQLCSAVIKLSFHGNIFHPDCTIYLLVNSYYGLPF